MCTETICYSTAHVNIKKSPRFHLCNYNVFSKAYKYVNEHIFQPQILYIKIIPPPLKISPDCISAY